MNINQNNQSGGGLSESQVNELIDLALENLPPNTSGGFSFGGDWEAQTTVTEVNAFFTQVTNGTIDEANRIAPDGSEAFYAYMRGLLDIATSTGVYKQMLFYWPELTETSVLFVGFSAALNGEDIDALSFNEQFGNPNTLIMGVGYIPSAAGYYGLSSPNIIITKNGNNFSTVTEVSSTPTQGDAIMIFLHGNALTVTNLTQNIELGTTFVDENLSQRITLLTTCTSPVNFGLNVDYPPKTTIVSVITPENPVNKTYYVTSSNTTLFGKQIKANDFVTFVNDANDEQTAATDIIVTRLLSDDDIQEMVDLAIVPSPTQHSIVPNPAAVSPLLLTDSNEFTINIDSGGGYDPNPTFSIHLAESCFNSGRLVIVRIKPQIDLGAIDFNYGSLHSPAIISGTAAGNMQILTFEKRSDYVELIALSTVSLT